MTRQFNEKFEATGYDESGSSESTSSNGTIDENNDTADAGSPSFWGDQCLKVTCTSGDTGDLARTSWGSLGETDVFVRIEVVVDSEDLVDGEDIEIFKLWDGSGNLLMGISLQHTSGVIKWQFRVNEDGTLSFMDAGDTVSLDTPYRIEMKYKPSDDTWEWKVDDTSKANGSLTSSHPTVANTLWIGIVEGAPDANAVIYMDLIAIDDSEYPGEETAGGGGGGAAPPLAGDILGGAILGGHILT